jgi:photosystem II stability/assembly factor-like uncharacterized protein
VKKLLLSAVALGTMVCLWVAAFAAQGGFEVLGIGGAGGMYTPSVSPYDPNFMLVSCDMSGSYRSVDGGKRWEMIHCAQLHSSRECKPLFLKDGVIWISGGTPKISHDKGATWKPLVEGGLPWKGQVTRLAAAPSDSSTLFAGIDSDGLWRSTDGGKTWKRCEAGKVNAVLALGPKVYASIDTKFLVSADKGATWQETPVPEAQGRGFLALTGGTSNGTTVLYGPIFKVGMLQSLDEGKTWKVCDQFRDCNDVLMASNQTKVAYAAQSGHQGAHDVYRTADGGKTWESCFRMGGNSNVEKSWVQTELHWGYYISPLGFGASLSDPNVALVSTQGDFYITHDGGTSWKQCMNIPVGVQAGDPGFRYQCNGLEVTSCWDYLFDPYVKGRTYIAYTDIGFARSVDRGKTWIWSAKGCPWSNTFYKVVFDPAVKGRMYAATSNRHDIPHWTHVGPNSPQHAGGVCVSDDGGLNWSVLGKGLPARPCTYLCIDPKSKGELTFYATVFEAGVYKSTDGGKTWVNKSNGLGNPGNLHAYMVKVHPKTGDVYCSVTAFRQGANAFPVPGGLWKSTDGGDSWTDITKDLKLHWPAGFAFDPNNADVIYLTAATIPGGREGGLYKTEDGGKSWKRLLRDEDFAKSGGQGYVHAFFVNLHPDKPEYVYLGTASHGLWMSPDAGKTWKRFNAIPFTTTQNVTFDPENKETMYVSTFGGGIWRGNWLP